jgi:uncharacterized glyoxalase superfamily protein PhnB
MNDTTAPTASTDTTDTTAAPSAPAPTVWPCVNHRDALAGIRFAVDVLGFVESAVYTADDDDTVVVHSQLTWPEGGGVMIGSADRSDSEFSQMPTGCASIYVVTDDPRAVLARCTEAGTELVRGLEEEDYGSLGFSVRDAEGNIWSFGTYRGE